MMEAVAQRSPNWRGDKSAAKGLGRSFSWNDINKLTELEKLGLDFRKKYRHCGCLD
jgi:hypothetical protein